MTFDPDAFVQSTVEDATSTQYEPIPEGEYSAHIEDVAAREPKEGMYLLDVQWVLDAPELEETLGLTNPKVRQSIFLDLDDAGNLELGRGKNVSLGRLREALGQNEPGTAWSPNMLIGQSAKVLVTQRVVPQDGGEDRIYNDVKGAMAA